MKDYLDKNITQVSNNANQINTEALRIMNNIITNNEGKDLNNISSLVANFYNTYCRWDPTLFPDTGLKNLIPALKKLGLVITPEVIC